jgi:hypothetical protein
MVGWVDTSAFLDTVSRRIIPSPRRETNPDHPVVQLFIDNFNLEKTRFRY